jgi:hypothetical protein
MPPYPYDPNAPLATSTLRFPGEPSEEVRQQVQEKAGTMQLREYVDENGQPGFEVITIAEGEIVLERIELSASEGDGKFHVKGHLRIRNGAASPIVDLQVSIQDEAGQGMYLMPPVALLESSPSRFFVGLPAKSELAIDFSLSASQIMTGHYLKIVVEAQLEGPPGLSVCSKDVGFVLGKYGGG